MRPLLLCFALHSCSEWVASLEQWAISKFKLQVSSWRRRRERPLTKPSSRVAFTKHECKIRWPPAINVRSFVRVVVAISPSINDVTITAIELARTQANVAAVQSVLSARRNGWKTVNDRKSEINSIGTAAFHSHDNHRIGLEQLERRSSLVIWFRSLVKHFFAAGRVTGRTAGQLMTMKIYEWQWSNDQMNSSHMAVAGNTQLWVSL